VRKVDCVDETEADDAQRIEAKEKTRRRFVLRFYRVWNLEQCELPQPVLDKRPKLETHEHDPIDAAERIIAEMPNPPEIRYGSSKA
jgi:antirestriction protein ArdC